MNIFWRSFGHVLLALLVVGSLYAQKPSEAKRNRAFVNLEQEKYGSFLYFKEQSNPANGLVRDRFSHITNYNYDAASIAATGFGLAAFIVGVDNGYITYSFAQEQVITSLKAILNMDHRYGFYYHFVHFKTGKKYYKSEISSIDTTLLLCGVIVVGEYFGGEVKKLAEQIVNRVQWDKFIDNDNLQFYMAYNDEKGFHDHWDYYAEQLAMYVLAAGSEKLTRNAQQVYRSFKREWGFFQEGKLFVHSWFGSLFTHQYAHAFLDFRQLDDPDGINWHVNSIDATLANYHYSKALSPIFKTFQAGGWGLSACDSPSGYSGYFGSIPSGYENQAHHVDGTVATSASIASIVFTPQLAIETLSYFYTIANLSNGLYGVVNAYNLDLKWFATDYIGIDKGIGLLMIANAENELIWKYFMNSKYVKRGLERLGFRSITK